MKPDAVVIGKFELSGHFKLIAHSKARGRRVLAEFDNLILDAGLNRLGTSSANAALWCQVGTGTTAPANSQTALVTFLASTSTRPVSHVNTYAAGPPSYSQSVITYRFAQGAATGTIAEVGVGWASSGSLFSRALILDGGGSPTTITVLSDESLDVEYTFRLYHPADWTGNLTMSSVSYAMVVRPLAISTTSYNTGGWDANQLLAAGVRYYGNLPPTGYDGVLGSATSSAPTGNSSTAGTAVDATYTNNSLNRAMNITFGLTAGNLAGQISALTFRWEGLVFQASFSPDVPKDATKIWTISFQASWARH